MSRQGICDVLIVGAGATGSLAALVFAKAGLDVVCLEQGSWVNSSDRPHSHADWSWRRHTNWNPDVNKRNQADDFPVESNSSQILMWNAVGGSTNVYGGLWPRYRPSDFRKGTEHGLQPDWPITYEDVSSFYELADQIVGVSGLAGDPAMPPRERCPTRPLPVSDVARRLSAGFDKLDWHWWPVEASVISEDYDDRPACNNCGVCNGCPRGSMNEFATSIWPKALRAGCELRTHARVLKIEKGADGRATGAYYIDRNSDQIRRGLLSWQLTALERRASCWPRTTWPTATTRSAATCCTTRWWRPKCGSTARSTATSAMPPR